MFTSHCQVVKTGSGMGVLLSRSGDGESMRQPRRSTALRWGVPLALAIIVALLGLAGVVATVPAGAGSTAQAQCSASAWDGALTYNEGDVVSYNDHQWRATHWMWPGVPPGGGSPPWWIPWEDLGTCGSTTTTEPGSTTTIPAVESVEDTYSDDGPWAISAMTASAPGTPGVRVVHPTDLGADGYEHPILVYGNGTGATCDQTAPVQEPLASWGFVVICPQSGEVGSGDEMLAAAEWAVQQDGNPDGIFAGSLDTDNIGVYGASQGGGGAVWALEKSDLITSALPVVLPSPIFSTHGVPDWGSFTEPVFYMWGADDILSFDRVTAIYNPTAPPKAMVDMVGVGHDIPVDRLPYMIAWFKYTLEGDQFARSAFVGVGGNPPEISTNSAWTNYQSQGLQ